MEFSLEPMPSLAELERQWRHLEQTATPPFFTSWHWVGTWLSILPKSSCPSLGRGSIGGETVALAIIGMRPLRRHLGLVHSRTFYVNESGDPKFDFTIEHNGLLVSPRHQAGAIEALIEWFVAHGEHADELRISGTTWRFPTRLVEERGLGRSGTAKPYYFVDLGRLLPSDGELYPVLTTNSRQQLRRSFRYFERQHGPLQITQATALSEAHRFFADLKRLHIAAWLGRNRTHSFTHPYFEEFHLKMIDRNFSAGVIELIRATAGPHVIGYLYNFRLKGHVYAYQSGFAYGAPGARPGAVAHALAIRDAYRSGAKIYDFLAGHNRLKASFATHSEPMFWQVIQQPRLAFRLERIARRLKQATETVW
jgi:CelD/BcsL family acetyltransferase involved in cellulose biosynthesis